MSQSRSSSQGGSLLGWFGRRSSDVAEVSEAGQAAPAQQQVGGEMRRQLMMRIADVILDNDLDVSAANLLALHAAYSGEDIRLERQIASRLESGEKITQDWLEKASGRLLGRDKDLEKLIERLETNVEGFVTTTKAARTATSHYNAELEQHVSDLHEGTDSGEIVHRLTALTSAMLERTRKVEAEMRSNEQETKKLRHRLAQARRDAEIDHLTGLPNRRAFETLLDRHYREARAAIEPLSVAFCDIDHFKKINDTHGHDTGDRVIQAIGELLSSITNDNCHVARHGGEEFVMLFRGLSPAEAQARLDTARERLSARSFKNRENDESMGQITFSGGVANVFGYQDPRAALKAADEALYRAKQSGRNRVLLA